MTEIRYALLDPTGNKTVLVETGVQPEDQPLVAGKIMELEPEAEQVGFVSADADGIAMRMAGGEFCGNAAMSAAVLFALDRGIENGMISVAVSGQDGPVPVEVSLMSDGSMRGAVTMPRPVSVGYEDFPDGVKRPVVRFKGITHVISTEPMDKAEAERLAPVWRQHLNADSLGIMICDLNAGTMQPLVYVPTAGTMFWENSCASGTTAVGAFVAAGKERVSLSLGQPGGTLHVESSENGDLILSGTVRLCRRRSVRSEVNI